MELLKLVRESGYVTSYKDKKMYQSDVDVIYGIPNYVMYHE